MVSTGIRCGASYGTKDQLNFYNKPCTQMNRNFDEFMNPQKYTNVANKIPELTEALARVQTQYATDRQYIGQAIALLALLKDLIKQR